MTSNYFVAENGVTRRSRRFSAFIGCLCDNRLGNNGNIHIVHKVEKNLHFLLALAAGLVRGIDNDLLDILVHDGLCQFLHIHIFLCQGDIRNQQPFYVTDEDGEETGEDVALDDSWNYTDILWNGIQAEKVQRAFEKLNYREQTLLEKRLAICMTCGRVGSWKNRPTFEDLAVMFEGSTASGAERAYRKAMDKLTELLVAEGAIHAVRLKQKSKTKRKKKITAAIYEYQADCDGEWGEISVDFENGTAEIIRLADWDTIKTNWFANEAIRYILSLSPDALKKYMLVPLEPPLIS